MDWNELAKDFAKCRKTGFMSDALCAELAAAIAQQVRRYGAPIESDDLSQQLWVYLLEEAIPKSISPVSRPLMLVCLRNKIIDIKRYLAAKKRSATTEPYIDDLEDDDGIL